MKIPKVLLKEKIKNIKFPWTPVEVLRFNDQVVRVALFKGEFEWHNHENNDELFYVLKGSIIIQIKGQPNVFVSEGELAVVKRGVNHCSKSFEESIVLIIDKV